ncbi:hypothetical protein EAD96_24600 [Micromonospora sp. BL1]|uniref:hypothetical protein n=1 Tax=Micromonospora sp. BL1 TaxID=2478709 RepID=UPI000EF59242|nr:hypothetical protein [Micromonospora sp. BL1]RLQ01043.1 hypothetical protein EAD96_24600 [Micromonospora sp. BL1]
MEIIPALLPHLTGLRWKRWWSGAKMANLDGSRRDGAKHEVEVAAQLLCEPGRVGAVYRLVLMAARDVDITPEALPDFLGLTMTGN